MAAQVEALTVSYTDNGVETVKELDKVILSKGAWATVIFCYQDWQAQDACYGPMKFTIRRYQKRDGAYQQKSKFNISSAEQAKKIIAALQAWLAPEDA